MTAAGTTEITSAPAALQPAPAVDAASAFYWEGLRSEKLLLQRCGACARVRFPPMAHCPYCRSSAVTVIEASGRGSVYSWIVVHIAFDPAFASDVPYVLATVDLEEGARLVARVEQPGEMTFGLALSARFTRHPTWTELRFTPEARP